MFGSVSVVPERVRALVERAHEDHRERRRQDHREVGERREAQNVLTHARASSPGSAARRSAAGPRRRSSSITTATADAPAWSPPWMCRNTKTDATSVLNGRLPAISTSAPISPTARANASATPERMPGRMFGSTMLRKTRNSLAPSARAASSASRSSSMQHRLHRPDDERQRDEEQREQDRLARERDVDPHRRLRAVEREQRQARDDRGQRERQVDHRVHDALAAEVVAHEHPGGDRPEDGVHERDDERGAEA